MSCSMPPTARPRASFVDAMILLSAIDSFVLVLKTMHTFNFFSWVPRASHSGRNRSVQLKVGCAMKRVGAVHWKPSRCVVCLPFLHHA